MAVGPCPDLSLVPDLSGEDGGVDRGGRGDVPEGDDAPAGRGYRAPI